MEEVAWQIKGQGWTGEWSPASPRPPHLVDRAAKHNIVLLATVLPFKVPTFWKAEDLKQNYKLTLVFLGKRNTTVS